MSQSASIHFKLQQTGAITVAETADDIIVREGPDDDDGFLIINKSTGRLRYFALSDEVLAEEFDEVLNCHHSVARHPSV